MAMRHRQGASRRRSPDRLRRSDAALQDGRPVDRVIDERNVALALETVLAYLAANRIRVGAVRADNGSSSEAALGFNASKFDGFYRVGTGVVVYTGNGSPSVLLAGGVYLRNTLRLAWGSTSNLPGDHSGNTMDLSLNRLQDGIMRVGRGDKGTGGTLKIGQPTAQPAAAEALRGTFWIEEGAPGVADALYMCMKDEYDDYAWVQIL